MPPMAVASPQVRQSEKEKKMARPNISLTEMEESVIKTIEDSDAVLDIYVLSDLIKSSTKQLRGVVSSLVKKGVVEWCEPQNIDCYNPIFLNYKKGH